MYTLTHVRGHYNTFTWNGVWDCLTQACSCNIDCNTHILTTGKGQLQHCAKRCVCVLTRCNKCCIALRHIWNSMQNPARLCVKCLTQSNCNTDCNIHIFAECDRPLQHPPARRSVRVFIHRNRCCIALQHIYNTLRHTSTRSWNVSWACPYTATNMQHTSSRSTCALQIEYTPQQIWNILQHAPTRSTWALRIGSTH